MRLSIQRLRWVLLSVALLLVVVLAAYIGYGRWRALKTLHNILAHSGATITHDTNGFTYSQSVQGKTVYTLHAKKATQLGEGKWKLQDAAMTLYGRIDGRPDHIYGSEIEYDENEGVARAIGEVHMDLQAPQVLSGAKPASSDAAAQGDNGPQVIHVKTSGLVYLRKLGVAATDQLVEFQYGQMFCTAQGAEFNTSQNILRLLADVKMDGESHGQPVHLIAVRGDIDRTENVAHMERPMVTSQGRTARSDSAVLDFETDGSIQRVQATGNVVMSAGTQRVTAQHLDAMLNDDMQLKSAQLTGGVALVDSNPLREVHASAVEVDALFDAKGEVTSTTAKGGAKASVVERKGNPRGLLREIEGETIHSTFVPEAHARGKQTTRLSEIHAVGAARVQGESLVAANASGNKIAADKTPQLKTTHVAADDLRMLFVAGEQGRAQLQKMNGVGHTLLEQDAPLGAQQTSAGDTLEMEFAQEHAAASKTMSVNSAVQTGHVQMHDQAAAKVGSSEAGPVSSGSAERAVYEGATERLTLTGDAHWKNDTASLTAAQVTLDQRTQDAIALGSVRATLQNLQNLQNSQSAADAGAPAKKEDTATHVLAASAKFNHTTQLAEFRGSDAQPAKMWKDASQVQAATLLFDNAKRTFSARPAAAGATVHAVFTGAPSAPKAGGAARAASVVRVASPKMDYNDVQREAAFSGGVVMDGTMGEVRGQRTVVFLLQVPGPRVQGSGGKDKSQGASSGGSLDRIVVSGDVQMEQPGRKGTGEQLLYDAVTDRYVLTGAPGKQPRIVDQQQGTVTGDTLLFGDAGSTIVVAGYPDDAKKNTRVHTETEVRQ